MAYRRETHIWYELDLARTRQQRELGEGLELRRVRSAADAALYAALQGDPGAAPEGSERWIVVAGDQPAFACEIYTRRAPMIAARGGWLDLTPEIAVLENALTSSAFRGRSVAPGAVSGIADRLAEEGRLVLLAKALEANKSSQRVVEKLGFAEIAEMRCTRVGPRGHVTIHPPRSSAAGHLDRGLSRFA